MVAQVGCEFNSEIEFCGKQILPLFRHGGIDCFLLASSRRQDLNDGTLPGWQGFAGMIEIVQPV